MRLESRTRLGRNHPGVSPIRQFASYQPKVVGLRHIADELAVLFPRLLFLGLPIRAFFFRFVFSLLDFSLDSFFFLGCICFRKRLIIFFNDPLELLSVDGHYFVSPQFGGLDLSLAVELLLDFALDVGVIALLLVIRPIVLSHHPCQCPHLLLRKSTISVGREVWQRPCRLEGLRPLRGRRRSPDSFIRRDGRWGCGRRSRRLILLAENGHRDEKQRKSQSTTASAHIPS